MPAMFIRYDFMGQPLIDWNIEEMCGYKPISTYFSDFSIAERFGIDAIKDTYDRAMKYWGEDIKWATEIAMVLNWKTWQHDGNTELCQLYYDLWQKTHEYVNEHFEGDDLTYYYRTTD